MNKRSAHFPEGYFKPITCSGCGRTYDPALGHMCGRDDYDPFNVRERRDRDDGEQTR